MKKIPQQLIGHSLPLVFMLLLASTADAQTAENKQPNTAASIRQEATTNTSKTLQSTSNPDLETIRQRVIVDLLQPPVNSERIKQLVKTIQPDGSWPDINYVDTSRTGFQHSEHLENMLELARAYKRSGSEFYGKADVKKTLSAALDFWIAHDFICANWWWNEMGTPNLMINTLLVLDEDLTEKQRTEGARIAHRANLETFGARPGGDLIAIAGMLGKQALFKRNEDTLQKVINTMAAEIKISNERGLQPDMSFHHRVDNVISTLTYGTSYASAFAYWAVKIAGTKYTFPEDAKKLLIDYYLDGISKSMVFGKYPDVGAENRDMSRKGALEPASAAIPQNLLQASTYRRAELEELVKIRKGEKKPNVVWDKFFWHSEYFTHQRPLWFSSVRMHSSRQNTMEEPHNEEGLKMHHFADGSNFINLTGKEYLDIFPVWDWLKIPGTTIVQSPALPHWKEIAKKGRTGFVGGVSDGTYGSAAFDFASPLDPLKARKSWFFFDKEYVCLGAGITSEAVYPVATTLNQCLLNKDVVVKTKGTTAKLEKGKHNLQGVSWVLHDGVGYLFPVAADVHLANETVTGNWRQINHQAWATEQPVQKEVFTLWLDHGTKPENANYTYVVIPNASATTLDQYRQSPATTVLANTLTLQAVQNKSLHISQVVFYEAGSVSLDKNTILTAESSCMVMVQTHEGRITRMTVSDPSRKLTSLQLSVNAKLEAKGEHWQSRWDKEKKRSVITVELPTEGFAGKSVVLELKKT